MRSKLFTATVLFTLITGPAPAVDPDKSSPDADPIDIEQKLDQYVTVELTTDLTVLSDSQRRMIPLLIEAAQIMDDCFWYEAYGDKQQLLSSIEDKQLRRFARINYGPWDRLDGNTPFIPAIFSNRAPMCWDCDWRMSVEPNRKPSDGPKSTCRAFADVRLSRRPS